MEGLFRKISRYPILFLFSGVVIVLCLVNFVIQIENLFAVVGWFYEMINWYLFDGEAFWANLGNIIGNGFYLLTFFLFTLQFLAIPVLLVLSLVFQSGKKWFVVTFCVLTVLASSFLSPIYELVNANIIFSDPVAFLYRAHGLLPTNLTLIVIALFLWLYTFRKKLYRFTLLLLIAAGLQLLTTLMNIVGSAIYGMISVGDLLGWVLGLLLPVLWVYLGCLVERQLTKKPVMALQPLVDVVNDVHLGAEDQERKR